MKSVTYGPFPGGWPEEFDTDFARMAAAGFNAIRLFEMPGTDLLDAAARHGLQVFGGLKWGQNADFFKSPGLYSAARVSLVETLRIAARHPALAGVYVGNEVPSDLTRWMGPVRVREALEELIDLGREIAPWLMFAYANYPSTEYLEPGNADFSAFNVYLEDETAFRKYLKRLHHIAGDRPLVISEFGLDSSRNGLDTQARTLRWGAQAALDCETAGVTIYAWSDRWWNNGQEILDWDFGMIDRENVAKPALAAVSELDLQTPTSPLPASVIVCTRNGRERIGACLRAVQKMTGGGMETIVVDDGSDDGTADYVAAEFPGVKLIRLEASGLSAARNAGAQAAVGAVLAFTDDDCEPDVEWIARIRPLFETGKFAAAGGPNLPPRPRNWEEAVVCAAPGAPSHVMLDDEEAEHLPGCNLVVTRAAFMAIGGFNPQFRTAGDDVDFCWRLREAGLRLGFAPGAFVWHWRRPSVLAFLRQQMGYGRAEKLLVRKHPTHFSPRGDARWLGFIYGGGAVRVMDRSIIYHGPTGSAGYQSILNRMLPLRALDARFDSVRSRISLIGVNLLQPHLRSWLRTRRFFLRLRLRRSLGPESYEDFHAYCPGDRGREDFIKLLGERCWKPAAATAAWDFEKAGTKVMLAIEHGENGRKTLLVRVSGNTALLPFPLQPG